MAIIRCDYCGTTKAVKINLRDYVFKRRLKVNKNRMMYFCSYDCLRKAEKESTKRYCEKRDIQ